MELHPKKLLTDSLRWQKFLPKNLLNVSSSRLLECVIDLDDSLLDDSDR